jgi:hypothetical protein
MPLVSDDRMIDEEEEEEVDQEDKDARQRWERTARCVCLFVGSLIMHRLHGHTTSVSRSVDENSKTFGCRMNCETSVTHTGRNQNEAKPCVQVNTHVRVMHERMNDERRSA